MGEKKKQPKGQPGEVVIALTTPDAKAHGEPITELRVRTDVRARDWRAVRDLASPMGAVLDMAAELAGVPPSTIDGLNSEDTMRLVEVIGPFLGASPATGKPSSGMSQPSSTSPRETSGE